jgi:serine phosphatase RsbU (regulator of sigma subunit)/anti-sigma regulatory factor (Ser/Thr protein kinase)
MTNFVKAPAEMAERIAAFDWASTALGSQRTWPASLRLMLGVALRSRFPMLIFWGRDLVQVYNDAFIPILGGRHPVALGQMARDCWPEIWETIGPLLTDAFEAGTPVWGEDWPLTLERNGHPEPTNFTFSYSQFGEQGEAGGVLCTCVETTKAVARESAFRAVAERLERELDREHRALLAFQNAALPKALPAVPGVHFDAIYEAAGEDALVGGDWYDAFRLTDGRIVISVGDVMGSGLAASVTMAAARQAIRGAAQVFPEPGAVLDAADRALRSEQPDRIVTAFLGIIEPLTGTLTYASAGHPPPLLRDPDGTISELAATDLPLGLRNERIVVEDTAIVLAEGAMLVLYTDGLTESTRNVFEGEQRLREALGCPDVRNSPTPAAAIRHAVFGETTDDVAILTVRLGAPGEGVSRWSFPSSDASAATRVRAECSGLLRAAGATKAEVVDAQTVFGELLGNVFRHTNDRVEVALDLTVDEPVLHVLDRGAGFTFYARLPKDTMSESGRGLFIASKLARDVSVVPRPGGGSHARAVLKITPTRKGIK